MSSSVLLFVGQSPSCNCVFHSYPPASTRRTQCIQTTATRQNGKGVAEIGRDCVIHLGEMNEQNMLHFLPDKWYSLLLTAVFGVLAYLAISWIRAGEERQTGKNGQKPSVGEIVREDYNHIVGEIKKVAGKSSLGKRRARRGSSSNIVNTGNDKERPTLKRQQSSSGMQMKLSWGAFLNSRVGPVDSYDAASSSDGEEVQSAIRRVCVFKTPSHLRRVPPCAASSRRTCPTT